MACTPETSVNLLWSYSFKALSLQMMTNYFSLKMKYHFQIPLMRTPLTAQVKYLSWTHRPAVKGRESAPSNHLLLSFEVIHKTQNVHFRNGFDFYYL